MQRAQADVTGVKLHARPPECAVASGYIHILDASCIAAADAAADIAGRCDEVKASAMRRFAAKFRFLRSRLRCRRVYDYVSS